MFGGFFLWFLFAVLVGYFASNYNRSGLLWFLLACILSPLISGIILLVLGRNDENEIVDNIERLKRAQQDYIEIYCSNESTVAGNPILKKMFNELSSKKMTSSTKTTVDEIEKYTNMLLMEIARVETAKSQETSNDANVYDDIEKLKKLLDINAITESEYNNQKEKLLSKI
ncbi:SHOCT domain-containing protein [Vibrio splendidus]